MDIIKKGLLFIIIACVLCSCMPERNNSQETNQEVTTVAIDENELLVLDSKPLLIIHHSDYLWGVPVRKDDNMSMNFIRISQMCEEGPGFPVNFQVCNGGTTEESASHTFVKAGLEADLIFPSSVRPSTMITKNKYFGKDIRM